jgi:lactoylglutathione lyase
LPDAPRADAGTAVSIGFFVDSLEETMEMLTNHGIKIARGPVSPDANTSFFFVNDPDGISVQFVKLSK